MPSRTPGSPIRTPTDQRSVGSSPWPIAASHVLHRRLVPRHPPCATLAWPPQKQDARTHYPQIKTHATHPTNTHHTACASQDGQNNPHTPTPTTTTHRRQPQPSTSTHQPESPTTSQPINHRPTSHKAPKPPQASALNNDPGCGVCGIRLFPQTPNSAPPPTTNDRQGKDCLSTHRATPQHTRHTPCSTQREASTFEPADHQHTPDTPCIQHTVGFKLLRKEVIQPHLPVRLPCYDFVPIASPTFTRSPPQRVRPRVSGVADFRDVTGGVYKARERIHRGVADPRLLATPPSWGRVADPNPN